MRKTGSDSQHSLGTFTTKEYTSPSKLNIKPIEAIPEEDPAQSPKSKPLADRKTQN